MRLVYLTPILIGLILLRLALPATESTAAPADSVIETVLIPAGAEWRYLDDGSDQGTAWQASGFDDGGWAAGSAQLGYGDGDEATTIGFGGDANQKHITSYFRTTFTFGDPATFIGGLVLSLLRDDGAIVYLNGTEIWRSNMPVGTVDYLTLASQSLSPPAENSFVALNLLPTELVSGTNVLAVEVHQASATSSDMSFDLQLKALSLADICPVPETRFAIIGDYGDNSPAEAGVAGLVEALKPDFVITLGDNNYPSGAAATIDANIGQYYQQFIGNYSGSYGPGATGNNFYPALGNHDWLTTSGGLPQPYLDYFTLPGNERYYTVTRGPVALFALDSDPNEPDGRTANSVQATWLQTELANTTAPWKLVYMHHPPYSSSSTHGPEPDMQWPFADWGASAVLAGHDHTYERLKIDGLPYFVNGLGGRSVYGFGPAIAGSQFQYNSDYGAMLAEASNTCLGFRFITRRGEVIDAVTLSNVTPPPDTKVYLPVVVK